MRISLWLAIAFGLLWTGLSSLTALALQGAPAGKPSPRALEFFERKIRPLLAERCFACHSARNTKGGLRLDTAAGLRQGGNTGPAVVPGDPEKSLLIQAVRYTLDRLKMPPQGQLPPAAIADLTAWVKMGAPWPEAASRPGAGQPQPRTPARPHWAFQPVRKPAVPKVRNRAWVKSPIDAFILARLEAKGLRPAPPADKRTLIRRVTFDLTGLPPTPSEIAAFLADRSPNAFAKVVDRLLASPAYGERWARHWLDVARYADSNGLDENTAFGNAWRYRDYVIAAFNQDKPYDQFIREQLAGDLLPPAKDEAVTYERLVATGFLGLGPKVLAEPDKQKMVMDIVDEQIDVTGKAFMALTISCARCHEHKFDPIPIEDYYSLAGIFKSTRTMATLNTVARVLERPLAPPEVVQARREHEETVRRLREQINKTQNAGEKQRLQAELQSLEAKAPPPVPMAIAVDEAQRIENCRVHLRGNHLTLGEEVPRRFLRVIAGENQPGIPPDRSGRLELAEWLTRPDHPLTARVMVNRIWLHHFGEGLVRTPDNFGALGERPTHPELLDWLAKRFVESGWSIKQMHRLILLSNTYQMSTRYNPRAARLDPENRLFWRFNRRRLEAEAIRDSILFVAGTLDRTMGGSLLTTGNFEYVTNDQSRNAAQYDTTRRSIYLPVIRNAVFDFFQIFDFVEPSFPNGKRSSTTVAPQALYLLNSPFVIRQARAFAERLLKRASWDDARRVRAAYLEAYGRPAAPDEVAAALAYLEETRRRLAAAGRSEEQSCLGAWQSFCQLIFASSEFIYVD